MKRNLISLIMIGILFSMSLETFAQDDLSVLNIQGVIRDEKGGAVDDGDYQFTFKIYDSEDGTVELWSEINTLTVTSGVYSANLGETTTFASASLGFDKPYYVGVQFESEAEASPRIRLTAAPYALALQGGDNTFPSSGTVTVGTADNPSQLSVEGDVEISGELTMGSKIFLNRTDTNTNNSIGFNTGGTRQLTLTQLDTDDLYFLNESAEEIMSFKNSTKKVNVADDLNVGGDASVVGTMDVNNLTIDGKAPFVYQLYDLGSGSSKSLNTGVKTSDYWPTIMSIIRGTGDIDENGSTNLWTVRFRDEDGVWVAYMIGAANSSDNRVQVIWIKSDLVSTSF